MPDDIPLTLLDERYGKLRIVKPAAERAMRDSMQRLGQLMPIAVCERQGVFAVVDGFKRAAAARALGFNALRARVLPLTEAAAIASIVTFNRHGRGLTDIEEAMVVKALCRDQGLMQVEVAEMVCRDKSWVCRRLSLAERLVDDVANDVRAGLISTTIARELARLPRGNQVTAATSIRRHALTSREATQVVTLLEMTSSPKGQMAILDKPREALDAHGRRTMPAPVYDSRLGTETQTLHRQLHEVLRASSNLCLRMETLSPMGFTPAERQVLLPVLAKMQQTTKSLLEKLDAIVGEMEET